MVAAVVALGLLGETYSRYVAEGWQRERALFGFGREHSGQLALTCLAAECPDNPVSRTADFAEMDAALRGAAEQGADVAALRLWGGELVNPVTGASFSLDGSFFSTTRAVAGFGTDWEALGALDTGRAPAASGEIALRRSIAAAISVGIGDTVFAGATDRDVGTSFTVVGIVRDPILWKLGNSVDLTTGSGSVGAIVPWADSRALSEAMVPLSGNRLWTMVQWNGQSESLVSYFGETPGSDQFDPARRAPGMFIFVWIAAAIGILATLAALVIGPREPRPHWTRRAPLVAGKGVGAGALGGLCALAIAIVVHVGFDLRYPDLIQPRFTLPPLLAFLEWIGVAAALALLLDAAARVRHLRVWRSRPARALASARRGLASYRHETLWVAGLAVAGLMAWPWLDRSMVLEAGAPPPQVLLPLLLATVVLAATAAFGLGEFTARLLARGGRPGTALPLARAFALLAAVASLLGFVVGPGLAADAAARYDRSLLEPPGSDGLSEQTLASLRESLARPPALPQVDSDTVAQTAVLLGFGVAIALVLAGVLGAMLNARTRWAVGTITVGTVVGALAVAAVVAALTQAPLEVRDVNSWVDGLQSGRWTLQGWLALGRAFGVLLFWLIAATSADVSLVLVRPRGLTALRRRIGRQAEAPHALT